MWVRFGDPNDLWLDVVVGQNEDGRLEIFGIARDETAWHSYQDPAAGVWSPWSRFHTASDRFKTLVVGQNEDGRLEVFGIALDGTVWHTYQESANGGWKASGGADQWSRFHTALDRFKTLVVGQNKDHRLEVFGIALDDTAWHTYQEVANGGWGAGGGPDQWGRFHTTSNRFTTLAVGQNDDGRLEVFGVDLNQNVWHTYQEVANGGWKASGGADQWDGFPGGLWQHSRTLVVGQNKDRRLEVFGIAPSASPEAGWAWHTYQEVANGTWDGPHPFHVPSEFSALVVGQNANVKTDGSLENGRLEVFGISHGFVFQTAQTTQTSSGWTPVTLFRSGGVEYSAANRRVTCVVGRNKDGRLEIFGIDYIHGLWHAWQSSPDSW